jgi:hypothetical protein
MLGGLKLNAVRVVSILVVFLLSYVNSCGVKNFKILLLAGLIVFSFIAAKAEV